MGSRLEANSSAVRKRIERHKFEDEEGEEYESSKFGGFSDYFRRKKIKLQNRDAARREASDKPQIFRGVVAHVNGYTQPSLNDLHNLIIDHGGGFMQYLDGKTTVTHVIASSLTPKKKIEFRNYRIVKPAWIVDSIKAGKLLPWNSYRVVDEGANQNLLAFEDGQIVSQANGSVAGYRDQTDTSWYTGHLKSIAGQLNEGIGDDTSFPSSQFPAQRVPKPETLINRSTPEKNLSGIIQEDLDEIEDEDLNGFLEAADRGKGPAYIVTGNASTQAIGETMITAHANDDGDMMEPIEPVTSELASNDPVHGTKGDTGETTPVKKPLTAEEHNAILLSDPKVWKSTVVNPGFLKQYYEESRLHHLSTWKAELKSKLQAQAREQSASQQARRKRPPGARRYIFHVDFDSFFSAVSLKSHPEWIDKPAVVAHGNGSGSEIASCNYPARKFGVKNGMWMKTALELCPDLKVLPYDFKAYEAASRHFYAAMMETGGIVQSVSVDEALIDLSVACIEISGSDGKGLHEGSIYREQAKAEEIARNLRSQVKELTGCEVSVGIGGNILLAKVALRKAKPAGQFLVKPEAILDIVGGLTVQDLPGVAYSIGGKLEEIGVKFVKDVRELTKEKLMNALGPKTGEKIWDYSRGIDRTEVGDQVIRKSVSAEVNWGVRFVTQEQADEFVQALCEELQKRLLNEGVKGRQLTMKIMRKSPKSPLDPPKHLGHGMCDVFNRSVVLGVATNDKKVIAREAISIMKGYGFPPGELRGIGLQMTKLEPLKAYLKLDGSQKPLQFKRTPKPSVEDTENIDSPQKSRKYSMHPAATLSAFKDKPENASLLNTSGTQFILPSQVDPEVLAELPEDIRSKLTKKGLPQKPDPRQPRLLFKPKEDSPAPVPPLAPPGDIVPSASQLDPDTLAALPEDLRAEVLGYYHKSPQKAVKQAVLPQSPHKNRIVRVPTKTTPTKPRGGFLGRGRGRGKKNSKSTLTQANFVSRFGKESEGEHSHDEEISADFLAALPDDIRKEVLEQQRRDRLKKKGGLNLGINKKKPRPLGPQPQRAIHLPPRPPRPSFTSHKLTNLPELREAISAWFEEFEDEEPNEEDVEALASYLKRVVLEERDMEKAVGVVKWLVWVVSQEDAAATFWDQALETIKAAVQDAVKQRGLGAVVF